MSLASSPRNAVGWTAGHPYVVRNAADNLLKQRHSTYVSVNAIFQAQDTDRSRTLMLDLTDHDGSSHASQVAYAEKPACHSQAQLRSTERDARLPSSWTHRSLKDDHTRQSRRWRACHSPSPRMGSTDCLSPLTRSSGLLHMFRLKWSQACGSSDAGNSLQE